MSSQSPFLMTGKVELNNKYDLWVCITIFNISYTKVKCTTLTKQKSNKSSFGFTLLNDKINRRSDVY